MKWITREGARVDRVACPWLIKRFIDPSAQFLFVPTDVVLRAAREEKAVAFDTRGAELDHRDGKCTFEVMLDKYHLSDPSLKRLGRIVHGADIPEEITITQESAGLKAFADGLHNICKDDQRKLEISFPLYDALYDYCKYS